MREIEFPNTRREIIEAVRTFADPDFQRRVWVDGGPTTHEIEGLDTEITALYDDPGAMEDPYGQISITPPQVADDADQPEGMTASAGA